MNNRYLTVAGRIRRELEDIKSVVERAIGIWKDGQKVDTEND